MKNLSFIILSLAALILGACQDKDYAISDAVLSPLDAKQVSGQLEGDDYVLTWPQQEEGISVQVKRYIGTAVNASELCSGNEYRHATVETNKTYTYVLKKTDGTNYSKGIAINYTRPGATSITGVTMSQVDKVGGYDVKVTWDAAVDATSIRMVATNGSRTATETLTSSATSCSIPDVVDGDTWTVTLTAINDAGAALPATSSLKIGKTMIGFLGVYADADDCVANGDDDEASAWLWLHSQYPTAKYMSFKDIKGVDDINQFRVLFWLRDLEGVGEGDVLTMPDDVKAATPAIKEWYKNGGSILLWGHAVPFIETLGRIPEGSIASNDHTIGCGVGGWNGDVWKMAVSLNPGGKFTVDASSHPIYKGLEVETSGSIKLIAMKGAGWTEDHNCVFFNYPSSVTGLGNQEEACYNTVTSVYGIYPLAVWDSQVNWVSMLNIWEVQQGDTEFKGTVLCVGNGGCEFSMKNADGTPDVSAYPSNNPYQDNVLTLCKNSLEYLKTR